MDGTVTAGTSEVDQARVAGDCFLVLRGPGDEVFAGTVNTHGALRVRFNRPASESVGARIVALVEQAGATKAKAQLFSDKTWQRHSITDVLATVLVFAVPLAYGADLRPTLLRAMAHMIVASPCAVVLATTPPLLSDRQRWPSRRALAQADSGEQQDQSDQGVFRPEKQSALGGSRQAAALARPTSRKDAPLLTDPSPARFSTP